VTQNTIREEAAVKFRIESDEGVSRVLQTVATETPSAEFLTGHVRLLIEQGEWGPDIFVDAQGSVLRGGKQFTLRVTKFSALKTLLKEIAPPC
jgi:hypothetical protein